MIQLTLENYRQEVEKALAQVLRLAFLTRPTVADLAALAALDVSLYEDNALAYVTDQNRVYQLAQLSGAAASSPDVVAPGVASAKYPRARWLRVTSGVNYGPNSNAPLHSRSTGTLRQVRLYAGEGGSAAQLIVCMGAVPSLMIDQDGEQVAPLSAGYQGSFYRVELAYALMVFTANLRGAPDAIADPAVIVGQVRKVLAGLDGDALGLEGLDRVEIGPAQLVKEDEEERRFVYSAPVAVTCYVRNPDEDLTALVIDAEPELVRGLPLDRQNCVVQGLYLAVPEPASLTAQLVAGIAKVGGATVAASTSSRSWSAERDTYVDLAADGALTYSTVYPGAAAPALAVGSLRLGYARSDGAGLVSWTPLTASILTFRSAYQIAP